MRRAYHSTALAGSFQLPTLANAFVVAPSIPASRASRSVRSRLSTRAPSAEWLCILELSRAFDAANVHVCMCESQPWPLAMRACVAAAAATDGQCALG